MQGFVGRARTSAAGSRGAAARSRSTSSWTIPGMPGGGGTDHAAFVCAGAPAFNLGSNSWDYGTYTWHTNRDTYDKIVFDEIRNNATLTAMLVYLASEESRASGA
jgi:carboxypeptidase Q